MNKEPSTAFVLEQLNKATNTMSGLKYIEENILSSKNISFKDFFDCYLASHPDLKQSDIIRNSNLSRTYAYEILGGTKKGSRDKVIALCFAANMNLDETNHALTYSGNSSLYAKDKRDSIITLAINMKQKNNVDIKNVTDLNILLEKYNLTPLDI